MTKTNLACFRVLRRSEAAAKSKTDWQSVLHIKTFIIVLVGWLMLLVGLSASAYETNQAELDARISQLIEMLGADEYATREKAQAELARLGLAAFDALHEAQHHEDVEIAMTARYLVRSMRVNWALEDDPAEVKRILSHYGEQEEGERRNRMDRLMRLDESLGIRALARLVRFESAHQLSKHAALIVMNHDPPQAPHLRAELAQSIRGTIGLSKRPGSQWLLAYAQTLVDPHESLANWQKLTRQEHDAFTQFPERSSREIVRDLLRWNAELLRTHDRPMAAFDTMRRAIDLLDGTREEILDMVDWLMERKAWEVVEEVATRHSVPFEKDPQLLYRLAESQIQQGKDGLAEATAQQALQLPADDPTDLLEAALSLQERGLLKWADQVYRHLIQIGPAGSFHDLYARQLLAEMLHDVEQDLEAAEVLQKAVDSLEDPSAKDVLRNRLGREPGSVKSRTQYFYSRQAVKSGDRDKEEYHLKEAVKADPTDADVLIAMYRFPDGDDAWRNTTRKQIEAASGHFRDRIAIYERQIAQAPPEPLRTWANHQLASENNQLAWLIGNTIGDYDEAVRCSKRSLELRPDSGGFLDTLARCYYAKGDFENAVKYQKRAVALEPHSQQIQRQLELFEKALADHVNDSLPTARSPGQ